MRNLTGIGVALYFLMGATLAVAAELPRAEPTEVGLSQERLDKITAVLEGDVARKTLAGGVLLIARHGKVAYSNALGARDPQANAAMSEDAIFRIYSMSKVITVAAALTLVEDGLVSLDDPIAKYMPQFAHMNVGVAVANPAGGDSNVMQLVPARRPITVQDLMRHSSGYHLRFLRRYARQEGLPGGRSGERQVHQRRPRGPPRQAAARLSARHDLGLRLLD